MDGGFAEHLAPSQRRRSLRRSVQLEAEVMSSSWDGAVSLIATELSQHGIWLQSELALQIGEELSLSFIPPHWQAATSFHARAKVVRVDLQRRATDRDHEHAGMGLDFIDLCADQVARLVQALRGLPPPLPRRPPLDPEITLILNDGRTFQLQAEAPLLTGTRRRHLPTEAPPSAAMTAILITPRAA